MNRTRIVFFVIIGLAVVIVAAGLILQLFRSPGSGQEPTAVPGQSSGETLEVQIVTALPVAEWVQEAANQFNAEKHTLEGSLIHVTITPMDGLAAKGRYDRDEMNPLPTAWIPESRYLVELVNAAQKERLGRDVFLTDGEYRARPLLTSLLAWGMFESRAKVLESKYGADFVAGDPRCSYGPRRLGRSGRPARLGVFQAGHPEPDARTSAGWRPWSLRRASTTKRPTSPWTT